MTSHLLLYDYFLTIRLMYTIPCSPIGSLIYVGYNNIG